MFSSRYRRRPNPSYDDLYIYSSTTTTTTKVKRKTNLLKMGKKNSQDEYVATLIRCGCAVRLSRLRLCFTFRYRHTVNKIRDEGEHKIRESHV